MTPSDILERPASGFETGRLAATCRKMAYVSGHLLLVDSFTPVKRLLDIVCSAVLLVLSLPVFAFLFLSRGCRRDNVLVKADRVGKHGRVFHEYLFEESAQQGGWLLRWAAVRRIPALINVLAGQMSFIGPRAISPADVPAAKWSGVRSEVKPGLICLWWLRRRANIDFEDEAATDREYVETATLGRDLGIACRALPALFYGERGVAPPRTLDLLGMRIDNVSMTETLDWIAEKLGGEDHSRICFVNPHCANLACTDGDYRDAIVSSELVLADGIGIKLAGKLKKTEVKQNVNGTDLFPRLCAMLSGTGKSIYLLGARPGVAERVAEWVRTNYPEVLVAGVRDGYFTSGQESAVVHSIRQSGASVLLLALGVPLQDVWIRQHVAASGVQVAMGVGGLFDFYSGRIPRAPLWMREIGMEWTYRLYQEPGRMWKRYLIGNWAFLARVLLHEFKLYTPKYEKKKGLK